MTFFEYSSAAEAIESELDFFREFWSGLSVEEVPSFEPLAMQIREHFDLTLTFELCNDQSDKG